ncbi:sulfate adenylyltransferase subunit 1 [Silvibacterium bohemicum]|uniref:Sulfate adenylyltransferase subunit 1 n=1 Tax=Silvibacterium bohemicum TaxID=1577686 RepID=A0A841JYB6_9BACT|nr:sulfate adenylyltransferase subunit CysN [Silvibacterium bohemicum]MBB6145625.1 sulfate adenylyltransferase subunit 1 [Silvibacterium bohemicum]
MSVAAAIEFQARVLEPGETELDSFSIEDFLTIEQGKDLLRFTTAGSVDDGKSTLIGRLLYDSKNVYEDHVRAVTRTQGSSAAAIDFAQLTDGLRAEREQGITIDVAYRYFSTARRKFIIADTPGHEQYTRNMATGASTADLAIILVDARKGILNQSRRHAYIASLLGIPRVIAAINKMDLVDYSEAVFRDLSRDFADLAARVGLRNVDAIPISALEGDNVVHAGSRMPWYHGPALLEYLESTPVLRESAALAFRLPVQRVIRPNQNFRGFAGQIAAGTVRRGDRIVALPSGHTSRVQSIVTFDGELESASAPLSVTVTLEDERDISRGDLIAAADAPPQVANHFEAAIVWLHAQPLEINRRYLLKHTSHTVPARVRSIRHQIDIASLDPKAASTLDLNAIGLIEVETDRPVLADLYNESRATGSFILIDPASNATVGAGMIRHILTRTSTNSEQPSIVIAKVEILKQLEQRILDLGHAVVRTRVQDEKVWRALQHAGVTVLVESDQPTIQIVDADFTRREIKDESIETIVDALSFAAKVEEKEL